MTDAHVDYEGSITISEELMEAARIIEHEQVHVWNVTNGKRVVTYAIRGPRESGVICINGAAAHLMSPGDLVIIAAFVTMSEQEALAWKPTVVLVDDKNRVRTSAARDESEPEC